MEQQAIEFKILSKRLAHREYDVQAFVNDVEYLTYEYSNCNNAFAAHTVLRKLIFENPNAQIKLKTNVNTLLSDIRTLETNDRTLTRYLREVLDDCGSQLVSAEYISL